MPIISRFYGIIIYMFWRDHSPSHFHAKYGDDEITIEIDTGIITSKISKRVINIVQERRKLYKDELMNDWGRAEQKKALFAIKPLE